MSEHHQFIGKYCQCLRPMCRDSRLVDPSAEKGSNLRMGLSDKKCLLIAQPEPQHARVYMVRNAMVRRPKPRQFPRRSVPMDLDLDELVAHCVLLGLEISPDVMFMANLPENCSARTYSVSAVRHFDQLMTRVVQATADLVIQNAPDTDLMTQLPNELLVLIMDKYLDLPTSQILGATCRRLHNVHSTNLACKDEYRVARFLTRRTRRRKCKLYLADLKESYPRLANTFNQMAVQKTLEKLTGDHKALGTRLTMWWPCCESDVD